MNKFPHKTIKHVSNGIRPSSATSFLGSLSIAFQPGQSEALNSVYHFTFTGEEKLKGTVVIKNQTIQVLENHQGNADLHITADSKTWIAFLAKEKNLLLALLTRKIKIKGSPKLLLKFAKCFPS